MRRKGGKEVPSADEVSDEGVEGRVFSSRFIGGVRRSWVSVRAIAESGTTLRGDRDEPICEKALSPREYTANVGLSFRNRVAKCRARLDELRRSGGEEAGFVTLTDKMAYFLAAAVVGKVFATDEVKIKT